MNAHFLKPVKSVLLVILMLAAGYEVYLFACVGGTIEWNGTVEVRVSKLGSRTGGRIKDVLVRVGDRVTAGQALLALEPGDLEAQRVIAEAQLEEAQAALAKLDGKTPAEVTAPATAPVELRIGRARVKAAEGRIVQLRSLIDELTIRAPRPGRVEFLDLRPGEILAAGAVAATVLEEDQLYVHILVPEPERSGTRVGQELAIRVDTSPESSVRGIVEHIDQVDSFSLHNLQTEEGIDQVVGVRVAIAAGRELLRAGMTCFVQVPH